MPLARFRLVATAGEPIAAEINGKPLDGLHVLGYSVGMVDGIPQVSLTVAGEGTIEGEGLVVIEREGSGPEELRQLIRQLDPEELDRKALQHAPSLDSKPGDGYKSALLEMLGEPPAQWPS